jgi:peptidoglycan/xylan/chitin deacetylase (PgdA/CDA1 family)
MKRILVAATATALLAGCATLAGRRTAPLGAVRFERIAVWRDDARGAYSIVHDDMCDDGVEGIYHLALPALLRRGLRVGVAPIAETCTLTSRWHEVEEASAQGHEIVSHSYNHPRITPENAEEQVVRMRAVFARHAHKPVDFFVFPYDFFLPVTVAAVQKAGYLGTRAGSREGMKGRDHPPLNPAEPTGDYAVVFDVWPHAYSRYSLFQGVDLLNVYVWDAIEHGGWAMREVHGVMRDGDAVEKNGFGPVPLSIYEAHLDFLAAAHRANLVWTAPPSEVIRYRHARTACSARVEDTRILFDASAPECTRYATPISVVVSTRADLTGLAARQRGRAIPVLRLKPGEWSVTADPTGGDVALFATTVAPATVDAAAMAGIVPPRPVTSVCDVERMPARGADWMLDDFERPGAGVDADDIPNWGWYPPAARLTRTAEAGNVFGRFTGRGLAAWSGVTYMFGGRDGTGVCYQGSGHHGLRFRIRGRVEGPDEQGAGSVLVALITAETRPRQFGGDLDGDGGHFHKVVPVTPEWRTVEIPWRDFDRPTWGATANLEKPALDKLEAFDWGVTNTVTAFQVDLDDVALF